MAMINDDTLTSAGQEESVEKPTTEANATAEAPVSTAEVATPEPTVAAEAPAVEATPIEPPVAEAPAQPAPAPAPPKEMRSDEELFEAAMAQLASGDDTGNEGYRKLSKGDRIEATVIQVEVDRVFVDLGTKSEGVVPLPELSEEALESAVGVVNVGDKIQVIVLRPEGGAEGNPIVSKKRADFEETWNRIVDSFSEGRSIQAQVVDRVKGGLVVDVGVRGFVPATHVGNGKLRNIEKYVGTSIPLKVIEIDRDRKKVVLSNRLAMDEMRDQIKDEIFVKVKPGDVLEGTVRRLTDYGAFIDLGGIDGLLHISEMSWMRINHPREVLKEGQDLKVMVLRLDKDNSKISLGLRQVLPDPWNLIRENYKIGQKIQCNINRMVQNGAFVKLPEGAEAFLPVSEISNRRIQKPADVLEEGQEVELAIIDLRPDERRMVLSLRSAGGAIDPPEGSGAYQGEDDFGESDRYRKPIGGAGKKGKKGSGRGRGRGDDDYDGPIMGRVSGGATIGERLGILKGFVGRVEDDDDDSTDDVTEEESKDEETSEE